MQQKLNEKPRAFRFETGERDLTAVRRHISAAGARVPAMPWRLHISSHDAG